MTSHANQTVHVHRTTWISLSRVLPRAIETHTPKTPISTRSLQLPFHLLRKSPFPFCLWTWYLFSVIISYLYMTGAYNSRGPSLISGMIKCMVDKISLSRNPLQLNSVSYIIVRRRNLPSQKYDTRVRYIESTHWRSLAGCLYTFGYHLTPSFLCRLRHICRLYIMITGRGRSYTGSMCMFMWYPRSRIFDQGLGIWVMMGIWPTFMASMHGSKIYATRRMCRPGNNPLSESFFLLESANGVLR